MKQDYSFSHDIQFFLLVTEELEIFILILGFRKKMKQYLKYKSGSFSLWCILKGFQNCLHS